MADKPQTDNPEKHPYDNIFKDRWTAKALDVLKKQLKEDFSGQAEKPTEFSRKLYKADFVYLEDKNGQKKVFHLEIQTADDPKMLARMLLYAGFLYDDYGVPITQVVLYLGNNKTLNKANIGGFNYEYKVIYIKNLSYETFLKSKDTLAFAILGGFGIYSLETVLKDIFKSAEKFLITGKDLLELQQDIEKFSTLRGLEKQVKLLMPKIMPFDIDITKTPTFQAGELKGKLEEKLAIAEALILDGLPLEQVMKFTGLTLLQITTLQLELSKKNK